MKDDAVAALPRANSTNPHGTHLIVEPTSDAGHDDPERIEAAFRKAVRAPGATLRDLHRRRFAPRATSPSTPGPNAAMPPSMS